MITRIKRKIKKILGLKHYYASETSKVRHLVIKYCIGAGCDIGFGGDKIVKENCLGIDYATPYASTGKDKVDIPCDLMNEKIPVGDNTFDYVYTSHLIEDFVDTKEVLLEFIRILKSGGNLILVFPDQKIYEQICSKKGLSTNIHHIHKEMGMNFMIEKLNEIKDIQYKILFSSNCDIDYNVVLVFQIIKE
ncbi:methyltransferase domain-containing protein [Mucilaginibacter sp.]|uniref:methyltransferase domain-containing protein n=1 Tax=Mucilaginibacter sp. TaxID=1882438 RepID=UPI002843F59A|nr:methyltransferase domain-containing protein [Mucilaginibacter sp.]MDR3696317.1 methyltransferase domain-containing protein [Mucilaginibacter sp.]